jgi:hypothetical protein
MMAGRRYTRDRATFFPLDDGGLVRSQKLPCVLYREFQIQPPLLDVLARSGGCRKRFLSFQILKSHGHEWQKGDESMNLGLRGKLT